MVVQPIPIELNRAVVGRSLWQDAWIRLRRNRAAVASAIVLAILALVGIFGPLVWPHPYDRVYPQFVRVPASLEAYPRADTIMPGFETRAEAHPAGARRAGARRQHDHRRRPLRRADRPAGAALLRALGPVLQPARSTSPRTSESARSASTSSGCTSSSAPTPSAATSRRGS